MFRKARCIAFCLFFVLSIPLNAYLQPGPFEWVMGAQFLYFLPSIDDTSFVQRGTDPNTSQNGNLFHNKFAFQPAFRVDLGFGYNQCRDVFFHYTFLQEKHHRTVTGTGLWATQGDIVLGEVFTNYTGLATSHLNLMYQQFELLFSRQLLPANPCALNLQLGFEIPNLRLSETIIYQSTTDRGVVERRNNTWGIGPEIGFKGDFDFFSYCFLRPMKLAITWDLRTSLLAARVRHNHIRDTLSGTGTTFISNDEFVWRVIPALHTRIGLNNALFCKCCAVALEIGYEFNSYFRGITRITQHGEFTALQFMQYNNFDLHGLYLALDIGF